MKLLKREKWVMGLLALMPASVLLAQGAQKVELKTDLQKASYSIGQQIGTNMKSQGIEIDVDILGTSIKDALAGTPSRLSDEEMQGALTKMQQKVQEQQKVIAEKNKQVGDKYLTENKKKKNIVTTASGLQYEVVKEGKGAIPGTDSHVKVHYAGTLLDGKEFDSSYKRNQPAEFAVGGVIPGWTEALKLMKEGSIWNLTIPADLAYGERGRPGIPPNSVLLFKVELLEIQKTPPPAPN